jgi:hypothetical protein
MPPGSTVFSVSNRPQPTRIQYGANLSAAFQFRLQLALADFKGIQATVAREAGLQLAKVDTERPQPPSDLPN